MKCRHSDIVYQVCMRSREVSMIEEEEEKELERERERKKTRKSNTADGDTQRCVTDNLSIQLTVAILVSV